MKNLDEAIPDCFRCLPRVALSSNDIMDDEQHMLLPKGERWDKEYRLMLEREQCLADNAAYVIATSLHLALPCIAMGIPVILFSSIPQSPRMILPYSLYPYCNPEKFDSTIIPPIQNIEEKKMELFRTASTLIKNACACENLNSTFFADLIDMRNSLYMPREKLYWTNPLINRGYIGIGDQKSPTMDFFNSMTRKLIDETDLIFYGAGAIGIVMLQNLYEFVKTAKSFSYVDADPKKHTDYFEGFFKVSSPEIIKEYEKDRLVVFITMSGSAGGSAEHAARYLEEDCGLIHGVHYFFYEHIVISLFQACFGYPAYVPLFYPPLKRMRHNFEK